MLKKNTENYYTVEQMKNAYENLNTSNNDVSDNMLEPIIENDNSTLKTVIKNVEQLFNINSVDNQIIINRKISMYEENKIIEQIMPMINIEIQTINESNTTVITFFDAKNITNQL